MRCQPDSVLDQVHDLEQIEKRFSARSWRMFQENIEIAARPRIATSARAEHGQTRDTFRAYCRGNFAQLGDDYIERDVSNFGHNPIVTRLSALCSMQDGLSVAKPIMRGKLVMGCARPILRVFATPPPRYAPISH